MNAKITKNARLDVKFRNWSKVTKIASHNVFDCITSIGKLITLTHLRPRWRGVRGAGTIFFLSQKLTILALTQRPGSAATIADAYRTPTTKDIIFLVGCT